MNWKMTEGETGSGYGFEIMDKETGEMVCGYSAYGARSLSTPERERGRLIEAAPELLRALERLLEICHSESQHDDHVMDVARAAIAHAEGKA